MINTKKSILAGILIGLGVIINLQSEIPALGALLFSFGLLTIINMQLNLYTGKIGFFDNINDGKFLFHTLFYNCVGIELTVALYALGNQNFIDTILTAANIKFSKDTLTLFVNACFCGALIHFAVKNKITILTIFAIMIFILIGAEHCVADSAYLMFVPTLINTIKFIAIILGNSLGAIIIERLCE